MTKFVIFFHHHQKFLKTEPDPAAGAPAIWTENRDEAMTFDSRMAAKACAEDHWSEAFADEYFGFIAVAQFEEAA
jgi:hypothetical protein